MYQNTFSVPDRLPDYSAGIALCGPSRVTSRRVPERVRPPPAISATGEPSRPSWLSFAEWVTARPQYKSSNLAYADYKERSTSSVHLSLSLFITLEVPPFRRALFAPLSRVTPVPKYTLEINNMSSYTSTRRHPASLLPKQFHDPALLDFVRQPVTQEMICEWLRALSLYIQALTVVGLFHTQPTSPPRQST